TIEEGGAKLVLVALGVPKQEKWITTKLNHLSGVVAIGLGGSFDVMAGTVKRAPAWMQRNRLEWLYRLANQPQRIGRMMALPKFMWAVKKAKK
ncbi:WecB/TagA/CpsF family glycosyltransferase, partial [uncultured Veillonella sp.]|uniref:WecB/TagA/CpsF family glycosyltransferase n=1 Tax=uncultured Veillonella sp. TaxID=159268 RepID=UPI0025F8368A